MLNRLAVIAAACVACSQSAPPPRDTAETVASKAVEIAPPTVRLPTTVAPLRYRAELDIRPEVAAFSGVIEIDVRLAAPTTIVWLNATGLEIESAEVSSARGKVAAQTATASDDFLSLTVSEPIAAGEATLTIRYSGRHHDEKTEGLYRVKEPDGTWFSYSMFEPIMARRVFPSFDEPQHKVPWTLSFRLAGKVVAATNSALVSETTNADGTRTARFAETVPLPTYLVAFMVGPFDIVEAGTVAKAGVPLRFILPPGHRDELAYAREVTPRIVAALEDAIGVPYPFDKLDVAVVPRFWGTMEHAAIVALGQPLTLIKKSDDSLERRVAYTNIAVHELCHYWFGDLVTMAWWDDVWLNESFGTWCDRKVTHRLQPDWRYDLQAQGDRDSGLAADQLPSVKRIRQPTSTKEAIESSFTGSITYDKGSAVITMFEHWVGEEVFKGLIRSYLEANAWGSASTPSFVQAMNSAKPKLGDAFGSFLDQRGAPEVTIKLECAASGARTLSLSQQRFTVLGLSDGVAAQTWKVPVCVRFGGSGKDATTHRQCFLLEGATQTVALDGEESCPDWFVGNADGSGYYRTSYDEATAALVDKAFRRNATVAEKMVIASDLVAALDAGTGEITVPLEMVSELAKSDATSLVFRAVGITSAVSELLPADLVPRYESFVRRAFAKRAARLGWRVAAGERAEVTELRSALLRLVGNRGNDRAIRKQAATFLRKYLGDPESVPAEVVGPMLALAPLDGDAAMFDAILAAARAATDNVRRPQLLRALGRFRDPVLAKRALDLVRSTEFDLRDSRTIFGGLESWPPHRPLVWAFIRDNFDELAKRMTGTYVKSYLVSPSYYFCDAKGLATAESFYKDKLASYPGTGLALENELDQIRHCIAYRERHSAAADAFFRSRR